MKAFGRIAESPLPLDMAPVLDRLLTDLTSYLRKTNRPLRQAALAAIEVFNLFLLTLLHCKTETGKAEAISAVCTSVLQPSCAICCRKPLQHMKVRLSGSLYL